MSTAKYRDLILEYLPRPIQSRKEYERALHQVENLMVPRPNRAQSLMIELLSTLIEQYERREIPDPDVPPAEFLAHCMEGRHVLPADLARATGISESTLSNILAGRRGISKANAVKLGGYFHVSPGSFLEASPPNS